MGHNSQRICIITQPLWKTGVVRLSNLIRILKYFTDDLYIITGNEGKQAYEDQRGITGYSINYKRDPFTYVPLQLKAALQLIKLRNRYDLFIFFMSEGLIIPVITAKILRKKVVLMLAASLPKRIESQAHAPLRMRIDKEFELINYLIADRLILYSHRLIDEWNLENYKNKIFLSRHHIINPEEFFCTNKLGKREDIVGYIGRLDQDKGILNLLEAIKILKQDQRIKFLIGGDGDLKNGLLDYISINKLENKVTYFGWISHGELPIYLNKIKMLVLPSYTEGLPSIMLEAMACETLVLATPVGAIPDYLIDGTTGFIMKDNSPRCIADSIVRALKHPDKERIASNARARIINEFTLDSALYKWSEIMEKI
jgi:glycosyltransferase involved in cell wall biosynthesis